jgi:hypothetical protein
VGAGLLTAAGVAAAFVVTAKRHRGRLPVRRFSLSRESRW